MFFLVPWAPGSLCFFLFPLHTSVLKPNFNVALGEVQARCQLISAWPGNVAVKQELFLQLQQLGPAVGCAASLLLIRVFAQNPAFKETQEIFQTNRKYYMNELGFLLNYFKSIFTLVLIAVTFKACSRPKGNATYTMSKKFPHTIPINIVS